MFEALKDVQIEQKENKFHKLDLSKPAKVRLLSLTKRTDQNAFTSKGEQLYNLTVFNLDTQQEEYKSITANHTLFVGLASLEADENQGFLFTPVKAKSKFGNFTKFTVERLD